MKITKRQLRRIIKEERAKLNEATGGMEDFKITLVVRVPEKSVEYVYNSILDGMEFDEDAGEGILNYNVQKVTADAEADPDNDEDGGYDPYVTGREGA